MTCVPAFAGPALQGVACPPLRSSKGHQFRTCVPASAGSVLQGAACPSLRSSKVHQSQRLRRSVFSSEIDAANCRFRLLKLVQSGLAYKQKNGIERTLNLTQPQKVKLPVLNHSIGGSKMVLGKLFPFLKSEAAACSQAGGSISPLTIQRPGWEQSSSCKTNRSRFKPDEWLEHCIMEIVRNIQEAPFLHLVFESKGNRRTERQRVTRDLFDSKQDCETAREDASWAVIRDVLSKLAPDGVILVERLHADLLRDGCVARSSEPCLARGHHVAGDMEQLSDATGITDIWGLLFLGETASRSACYILKTTRVSSAVGICTRFCLTRAQCFGPSVREQLERIWLARSLNG